MTARRRRSKEPSVWVAEYEYPPSSGYSMRGWFFGDCAKSECADYCDTTTLRMRKYVRRNPTPKRKAKR
jgi:hypothetical protein